MQKESTDGDETQEQIITLTPSSERFYHYFIMLSRVNPYGMASKSAQAQKSKNR